MVIHHRTSVALIYLMLLHGVVVFAGFLAPSDPGYQDREHPYAPPTRFHMIDSSGRLHLRPFVFDLESQPGNSGVYRENRSQIRPLRFFIEQPHGTPTRNSTTLHLFGVERPGHIYLLGTDSLGRDQFSRLLYGGRISLFSGLGAATLSLVIGLLLGSLAGYCGGWIDDLVMRGSELFMTLPWLYCLLAFRAFLPLHITAERTFILLVLLLGLRGWARPARLIRGVVLGGRKMDYVQAARGLGARHLHILRHHVFPQTTGILLTQASILIPQYILAEVTLSFLGLGVGEPVATWGNMLASLQRYSVMASFWWMYLPAIALIPVILAYHLVANALHLRLSGGQTGPWLTVQ